MTKAIAAPQRAMVDTLDWYLTMVNAAPMLSAEEELALARRFRELGDQDAAKALVVSHLRLVVRVARGYLGYGLGLADLVQEGTVGLMRAVKRFEPDRGVRLAPFAVYFVRAHIQEFVLRNWRIVKVATTKAQRKLFFKLRRHKARLERLGREEAEYIASVLDVSPEDVETMDYRLHSTDASLGSSDAEELVDGNAGVIGSLVDPDSNPLDECEASEEAARRAEQLEKALGTLDARSRDIVARRWLHDSKATLDELGDFYGISKERVRQIEETALARLKRTLSENGMTGSYDFSRSPSRSAAGAGSSAPAAVHPSARLGQPAGAPRPPTTCWRFDAANSRSRRARRPDCRRARREKRTPPDVPSRRPDAHLLRAL